MNADEEVSRERRDLFKEAVELKCCSPALVRIAELFHGTENTHAKRVLASIVLDESNPGDKRYFAYAVLFEVCNRDLWTLPFWNVFRIPDDFDVPWLAECVR